MSVFDRFADSPDGIRIEGQEITITFVRLGNGTARISWNIPAPRAGCDANTQSYDGFVITVSDKPANFITTSPKDGKYYTADPTFDKDAHAADVIDGARVVGAFYHDKTTTSIIVSDVLDKTAYYVSGYAVDSVARYHREGVHAYSLPTGPSKEVDTSPAYQDVYLDSINPIRASDATNLSPTQTYTLQILNNCRRLNLSILGSAAQTYTALVAELNRQFAVQQDAHIGAVAPDANTYYYDENNRKLYFWDGLTNAVVPFLNQAYDPTQLDIPTYWLDNGTLKVYVGADGWEIETNIINSTTPPNMLNCGTVWFDGTTVRRYDGVFWKEFTTIISERDPQLGIDIPCNSYWYDFNNQLFFSWDNPQQRWVESLVIVGEKDPNTYTTGDFWFNETDSKMYGFVGGEWNKISTGITYAKPTSTGNHPNGNMVVAGLYWYTPDGRFLQRNVDNDGWDELVYVSYPTEPSIRKSGDAWWNTTAGVNTVFVWDSYNDQWVNAEAFYNTGTDPSLPPVLTDDIAWYNPTTKKVKIVSSVDCSVTSTIFSAVDLTNIPNNYIWYDGKTYRRWSASTQSWSNLPVLLSAQDPAQVNEGTLWFNTVNQTLYTWNSVAGVWNPVSYSIIPVAPVVGQLWFNTTNNQLLEWNGSAWVPGTPSIFATFNQRTCLEDREYIRIATREKGCSEKLIIEATADSIFSSLQVGIIYGEPIWGDTSVNGIPMTSMIGVGTDGTPDERRQLHSEIRAHFGDPVVKVELTKEQIDEAIDTAVRLIRKFSGYGYQKGMFFLDVVPNQQRYVLKNQCVGFHKIVNVLNVIRSRMGAFRTAYAHNDTFAFSALQQMYTLGTFDILTFHLSASYIEELETLFAARIMYQWNEHSRQLTLRQAIRTNERLLLEVILERPEQELLVDRETSNWIKSYAIARCKAMLAQIRGKYSTLPGPSGNTAFNAAELQTQSENEITSLMEQLHDESMQNLPEMGMKAHFVIG